MDITKEGFLEFCVAQGDAVIQHDTVSHRDSAWADCAVGRYYTSLTGDRLPTCDPFISEVEDVIGAEIMDNLGNSISIETYPDLVEALA